MSRHFAEGHCDDFDGIGRESSDPIRPGPIEAVARDSAIAVSIALQFGADLQTIRSALTCDHDGCPATLLGAALDALVEAP